MGSWGPAGGCWGPGVPNKTRWGPGVPTKNRWGPGVPRKVGWGPGVPRGGAGVLAARGKKKVLSGGPDKNQVGPWGTASTGLPKRVGSRTRGPRGRAGVEGSREKQGWVPGQGSRQKTSRVVCTCRGHESTRIVVATKEVGPVGKGSGVPT